MPIENVVKLKSKQDAQSRARCLRAVMLLASTVAMGTGQAHANFVDGDFESLPPLTGWKQSGYDIPNAIPQFPPLTAADLGLVENASSNRSGVFDTGSDATTGDGLKWVGHVAHVHTSDHDTGMGRLGSGIEQQLTITAADVDADGKVHVRFTASTLLEASEHEPNEQPYSFIEITKSDGTTLFSTFNYAGEPGVPWQYYQAPEAVEDVAYTDWQAYDISLDPAMVKVGDTITLKAIAAGCGQGGHTGALYLNDVRTVKNVTGTSLWVTAEGPGVVQRHTAPDGTTEVTYTYTYTNNGDTPVDDVVVTPGMPVTTEPTPRPLGFVSIDTPSTPGARCVAPANALSPASCTIGRLEPGQSGIFHMTVKVPADSSADQVNNGNYPIEGRSFPKLLGPLVKTVLKADMQADIAALPAKVRVGEPYEGTFSCVNQGSSTSRATTCDVAGLPDGVSVGACTISPPSPGAPWVAGTEVPAAARVNCEVKGTPTQPGKATVVVSTSAQNDDLHDNDRATQTVEITAPDMAVDLSGLPATATVGQPYAGHFTCRNVGNADALAATTCTVTGLAPGITQGACTIDMTKAPWSAGQRVAAGQTVSCEVGGSLQSEQVMNITGTTSAQDDSNTANNTATLTVQPAVVQLPDLHVDLSALPGTGRVGKSYKGSFTCTNRGDADAVTDTSCVASDLPDGVKELACAISPNGAPWQQGQPIVRGGVVTCQVEGTPSKAQTRMVQGVSGSDREQTEVVISASDAPAPTPVPTLSRWGGIVVTLLLGGLAAFTMRRKF